MLEQATNCNIAITEFLKGLIDSSTEDVYSDVAKPKKKKEISKVSISKPKGDIEMKYVTYRPFEKRYIGRKQINKKVITVYAKTQRECLNKLNLEIKKIKSDFELFSSQKAQLNFITYWNKWYEQNKKPFIADTTKNDFNIIKRKLEPLYQIKLTKLSKDVILDFLKQLPDNRTKEKVVLQLKSILDTAVKERKIKYNPFDTIIFKSKKRKPKPPFNYEEQKIILENLKGKEIEPIILVYLTTGLRKNELDFANIENNIDKNNILTAINLKGRDREIRYKKIKLSSDMVKIIRDNAEVFHKYNSRRIFDAFDLFLKELNIRGSIVTCRHTFATNCFYLGKDSLIISREMGHSTSHITKDNYIDIDYNLDKEKILKLYNNLYNLN